jgi:Zn-dependent peptidase ImmA (M78 family)
MRLKKYQLIANEFWKTAGGRTSFPSQLEPPVLWTLPLAIIKIPRLCIFNMEAWLSERGIQCQFQTANRPLHGSLIAYRGRGCILLNGADNDSELRYSLSHETAHFLINYLLPRKKALSVLGPTILEVFDGFRAPTVQERVQGILSRIPIGFHVHFMERNNDSVDNSNIIMELEDNADLLALELIAPEEEVRRRITRVISHKHHNNPIDVALSLLQQEFGLPLSVADSYCRHLFRSFHTPSVREWLRQQD